MQAMITETTTEKYVKAMAGQSGETVDVIVGKLLAAAIKDRVYRAQRAQRVAVQNRELKARQDKIVEAARAAGLDVDAILLGE